MTEIWAQAARAPLAAVSPTARFGARGRCTAGRTARPRFGSKAAEIHDLGPRRHEVPGEFAACVVGGINLCDRAQFGV
jgi:hypothetical protein